MSKRVVVAMSGGVDSSLAAALLQQQGYEVIGITLQIWPAVEQSPREARVCCSLAAVNDARAVADKLGIPHYVLNFQDLFADKVINYFTGEYAAGRTPNPCIACNKHIKFGALLQRARELSADYLATGHYARIDYEGGRWQLKKAADRHKDQTYALYGLTQDQLAQTLFPLGGMTKTETRAQAGKLGLAVAGKPDSQEICFVPDDDYGAFLQERIPAAIRPGPVVSTAGERLGTHRGLPLYTVGQRKGLGIATGQPLYVVALRPESNTLAVGRREEVLGRALWVREVNWIGLPGLVGPVRVNAKIRYNMEEAPATVKPRPDDKVYLEFDEPQWAVTPGQAAVFYAGDSLLGGGVIERAAERGEQ